MQSTSSSRNKRCCTVTPQPLASCFGETNSVSKHVENDRSKDKPNKRDKRKTWEKGLAAQKGLHTQKPKQVVNPEWSLGTWNSCPPPQQDYRNPWIEAIRVLPVSAAFWRCALVWCSTLAYVHQKSFKPTFVHECDEPAEMSTSWGKKNTNSLH